MPMLMLNDAPWSQNTNFDKNIPPFKKGHAVPAGHVYCLTHKRQAQVLQASVIGDKSVACYERGPDHPCTTLLVAIAGLVAIHLHKFVVEVEPRMLKPPASDFLHAILAARRRAATGRVVSSCHAPHVVNHAVKVVNHACLPSTRLRQCRKMLWKSLLLWHWSSDNAKR